MADHRLIVTCTSDTSGGTSVLTVLGGKSSCRRKFGMTVHLVDSMGRLVSRDLILHAAVVYNQDHSPVLRGEKAAESPCFSTFNGIEFPASDKPTRMIAGRASFKLALSLLSSKCDNNLFAIRFTASHAPGAEQLLPLPQNAYSGPIRSISRKRNRAAGGSSNSDLPVNLFDELPTLSSPAGTLDPNQEPSVSKKTKLEPLSEAEVFDMRARAASLSSEEGTAAETNADEVSERLLIEEACQADGNPTKAQPSRASGNSQGTSPPPSSSLGDTPRGTPPVTFADLASMLTQAGAFTPTANHPSRPMRPSEGSGARDQDTMDSYPLDALNQASAMAAAQKMAAVIGSAFGGDARVGEGTSAADLEQRSLDEEERTLQYMEASLAEVTLELLRRREELSVRRQKHLEHEQFRGMAHHPRFGWVCPSVGH